MSASFIKIAVVHLHVHAALAQLRAKLFGHGDAAVAAPGAADGQRGIALSLARIPCGHDPEKVHIAVEELFGAGLVQDIRANGRVQAGQGSMGTPASTRYQWPRRRA